MTTGDNRASARPVVCAVDGTNTLAREEIGAKAWGVNRMRALGLSVPPAIVATTFACRDYFVNDRVIDDDLWSQIVGHMNIVEQGTGRRFGGSYRPLLVSVRSGAAQSMPGMMDTILNLGMNAEVEAALSAESGDAGYVQDTHRRFVELYRKVVLGDQPGDSAIPADPWDQLRAAIAAVFDSWHSPRAQAYRRNRGLSDDAGTAVMIQAMVFGNIDERSGTGVLFSRNPMTGEAIPWGEWLCRAQGEDVVSGECTPQPLESLRQWMPNVHAELMQATATLEKDARDIQDIEFTVESERLWLLQTRVAKRSPQAAVRTAVAFCEEGLISKEEAVRRLDADQIRKLPALRLAPHADEVKPAAVCEAACPGIATGVVVTDSQQAHARSEEGEDVILARPTTSPEDLQGVIAARAVMTEQGGSTSHAAVVSRELGRPCVVGCGTDTVTALAGERVTVDGDSGRVWMGDLTLDHSEELANDDLCKLNEWGQALIPMRLLQPDIVPGDIVDLDAFGDEWRAALHPGITVRGHVLETDEGIRAAMFAGVKAAVVRRRLPALLACLAARSRSSAASMAGEATSQPDEYSELMLLRLAELKGRAAADILADSLRLPVDAAIALYGHLCEQGLCLLSGNAFTVTREGKDKLKGLLEEERENADANAVIALYEDFCAFNSDLKQIMTAWQIRPNGALNDHSDAEYDRGVLQRLADLHRRAGGLLNRLVKLAPRLDIYQSRLERAATRIAAGDRRYVARIIADSYHTVWFELHEELLSLAGLSREKEARAGRLANAPTGRLRSV